MVIIERIHKSIENNRFFDFILGGILITGFGIFIAVFIILVTHFDHYKYDWDIPQKRCLSSITKTSYVEERIGHPRQNLWETRKIEESTCVKYSNEFSIKQMSTNKSFKMTLEEDMKQ